MDSTGWHARRRAAHQDEAASTPFRGPDGHFRPASHIESTEGVFIGGWVMPTPGHPPPYASYPYGGGDPGVNAAPPLQFPSPQIRQTGYPFVRQPGPFIDDPPGSHLSAAERSQAFKHRKRFMDPYLQFTCGPLLRYDNVDSNGVWHGAALIVTADAGSTYEPYPTLKYRWDPRRSVQQNRHYGVQGSRGVDLGPHPADPDAVHDGIPVEEEHLEGPNIMERRALGEDIYVHSGRGGTYTFWRFFIQIQLAEHELKIQYSINDGLKMDFFVPGHRETMRLAAYSCNGFSAGVNSDSFRGMGFQTGYDPVWVDLLAKHAERPFHVLVGGGDQLYCDGVALEPELQGWLNQTKLDKKMHYPATHEVLSAIDTYYFNHYCQIFRSGAFARANSSIPMLNMLDDHDLIDGFGSYPDDLQKAPVFNAIGSRGYFFFLLFQCFINDTVDGTNDRTHVFQSLIIGGPGAYVPYPSHSILAPIGATAWILMLDCRAERRLDQVCSEEQYAKVFDRLNSLPSRVEHLIVQLGIPIAYPRMVFLENALSSKFSPFVALGRLTTDGFVNRFNGDAELLDDLNDHWTSKHHKAERNRFIERLQRFALSRRIRVSFLCGDVHCAAVGVFKTTKSRWSKGITPASDHRYMLSVVTSAIVNTPPPNGVLSLVDSRSTKRHRSMHYADTDEEMVPLFDRDTDGSKPKSHYIMGRRNWCSITLKQPSGDLSFDIRVEKETGYGETVGYSVVAPPPRWTPRTVIK